MNLTKCRFCNNELEYTFANLGMSPLSNSYISNGNLNKEEVFYPLHAYVCSECFLVQLAEYQSPKNIFSDYAYFSSYSKSWVEHAKNYTKEIIDRIKLDNKSQVIEIASNDGYLLQFLKEKHIPVLGIEPAVNVAKEAEKKGIKTITSFFGSELAAQLKEQKIQADLLIANNVLAHVPDINDFVQGMKELLSPTGYITVEFPSLLQLMLNKQFDTIYHEHFSYLSLSVVKRIFESKDLQIVDVEELETHGGSLRVYATHKGIKHNNENANIEKIINEEIVAGLMNLQKYVAFDENIKVMKRDILKFLIDMKEKNKKIVAYGAPAKGNTLLNYCGIGEDFIEYTVDISPHKQGLYLPGSHIPIYSPKKISETKPDYVIILPWNIKDEIMDQMKHIEQWGGKFVTFIPNIEVYR